MHRHNNLKALLIAGLILILASVAGNMFFTVDLQDLVHRFEDRLSGKAEIINNELKVPLNLDRDKRIALEKLYSDEMIGIYVFEDDRLKYWNNSRMSLSESPDKFAFDNGIIRLKQGYFYFSRKESARQTVIALLPVRYEFSLQNKYLVNEFADWTGLPAEVKLSERKNGIPVTLSGHPVLHVSSMHENFYSKSADNIFFFLFILGYLLILLGMAGVSAGLRTSAFFVMVAAVSVFRIILLWCRFPAFFYRSILYDVSLFGNAQSFSNGYLGDLLINGFTLLFIALAFYKSFRLNAHHLRKESLPLIFSFFLLLLIVSSFSHTVKSLVTNSTFSFDFLDIFNMKAAAFAGLMTLGLYALSLFVVLLRLIPWFVSFQLAGFFGFTVFAALICTTHSYVYDAWNFWFENGWFLVFALIMYLLFQRGIASVYLVLGIQILVITVISSRFLNIYIEKNKEKELEILALKLSERQDPMLENEFNDLPGRIGGDKNLANLIRVLPATSEAVQTLLKQKYFSGYFDRYEMEFSLFDSTCTPLLPVRNSLLVNEGYFEEEIRSRCDSSTSPELFFARDHLRNSRYIARVPLGNKRLYVLLDARQFEELGSFPDLLMDRSQQKQDKLRSFSHAVYREKQLTTRLGDLNYPLFLPDSSDLVAGRRDYVHRYFTADDDTRVIISERKRGWTYFFTFNSYLLLFFSILSYVMYLSYASFFTAQFQSSSLTRRIQTVIIVLLLLGMSAIGYTSGTLITNQFENDNKKQLEEKTRVIINELSEQYSQAQLFEESRKDLINLKLKEYARLFNTPISLFDSTGKLFNTSEPKLYDLGLAPDLANPRAYRFLKSNRSSSYGVQEKAGTLAYLSYYTPLFDNNKKLLGLFNLPYFAKQTALETELSSIISALINVYVILFVISIFAGLILTGYITQPLRLIKQQLANVSFGKQNEKISWQSNDEIGKLVSEYNLMLGKLEESATLLARSERESAWREMAKQVAHEIKNPLTPMKLNLQYLQHIIREDPSQFEEKFRKASQGIIEQIDTLAAIATEFSNFAKLPSTDLKTINLKEIIFSSVSLFESHRNIRIVVDLGEGDLLVRGDHEQCLRVFNNIIKNAVQAVDEMKDPLITITAAKSDSSIVVCIADNGSGVPQELRNRLFAPNFTTKSTGSGLGLAMVKNIMEGFGGRIWFEPGDQAGAKFYLEFRNV